MYLLAKMDSLTLINALEKFYSDWGNVLIFLASFIETLPIGFLIPGGLIVALGGFYSYGEKVNLIGVVLSSTFGMMIAFLLAYYLGRKSGKYLVNKFNQEENAKTAKRLLDRNGAAILTTALLSNLTRFWISYVAGIDRFNIFRFIFYALVASLTWNSLFVVVGYLAGSERKDLEEGITKLGVLSYGFVILAIAVITWNIKREYKEIIKNNK